MSSEPVESPVAIKAPTGHRFGIMSVPTAPATVGVLVLPAHGTAFGGRTRFVLRLARRLAASGLRTLRIDYEGTGESAGGVVKLDARSPAVEDAEAAALALIEWGHDRIVLIGYCYGARVAMAVAGRVRQIVAVVLISPPAVGKGEFRSRSITDVARGALQPARWAALRHRAGRKRYSRLVRRVFRQSMPWTKRRRGPDADLRRPKLVEPFVSGLTELAGRGTPTLLVYGEGDRFLSGILSAGDPRVERLLDAGASSIEFHVLPGCIHGLRDEAAEEATIEMVTAWATTVAAKECRQPTS